ncbi:MAG: tRNA (adenosine(37)-N6)-dimethylallyltransferase MiaA, partial [Bacteroidales bacterium]|nr:tRNA (adenosine(37)-N6)-dimethylallyltransferase MiaA [Bacteroidales bacterium]
VGKTALAIPWAKQLDTQIISADSRQVYRELRIGVARPEPEELATVPHRLIAHRSIHDYYSVSHFETEALRAIEDGFKTHDDLVLTGGSGLYVQAVCEGMDELPDADPALRAQLIELYEKQGIEGLRQALRLADPTFYRQADLCNPVRLRRALEVCYLTGQPYSSFRRKATVERPFAIKRYALNRPREELYDRINRRVDLMIAAGLENEARSLYAYKDLPAMQTVGYREWFAHFDGLIDRDTAIEQIKMNSRRYAKRQITWLRHQTSCLWLSPADGETLPTANPEASETRQPHPNE